METYSFNVHQASFHRHIQHIEIRPNTKTRYCRLKKKKARLMSDTETCAGGDSGAAAEAGRPERPQPSSGAADPAGGAAGGGRGAGGLRAAELYHGPAPRHGPDPAGAGDV